MTPESKDHFLNIARTETIRVVTSALVPVIPVGNREPDVQKDDLARLLHLYKDPDMQIAWTQTASTMTRLQLDARHSTTPDAGGAGTLGDHATPWETLAERFNDYAEFTPQNESVRYIAASSMFEPPQKVVSWVASCHTLQILASHCYDIEPTVSS